MMPAVPESGAAGQEQSETATERREASGRV
jgi:hypothetical protein